MPDANQSLRLTLPRPAYAAANKLRAANVSSDPPAISPTSARRGVVENRAAGMGALQNWKSSIVEKGCSAEVQALLERLAAMSDEDIETNDIPEAPAETGR